MFNQSGLEAIAEQAAEDWLKKNCADASAVIAAGDAEKLRQYIGRHLDQVGRQMIWGKVDQVARLHVEAQLKDFIESMMGSVIDKWQNDKDRVLSVVGCALDSSIASLASGIATEAVEAHLRKVARLAVLKWVEDGQILIPDPSEAVRSKIDAALEQATFVTEQAEVSEATRLAVKIFRMHMRGVSVAYISKELGVSRDKVGSILSKAKARAAEAKRAYRLFFYMSPKRRRN